MPYHLYALHYLPLQLNLDKWPSQTLACMCKERFLNKLQDEVVVRKLLVPTNNFWNLKCFDLSVNFVVSLIMIFILSPLGMSPVVCGAHFCLFVPTVQFVGKLYHKSPWPNLLKFTKARNQIKRCDGVVSVVGFWFVANLCCIIAQKCKTIVFFSALNRIHLWIYLSRIVTVFGSK